MYHSSIRVIRAPDGIELLSMLHSVSGFFLWPAAGVLPLMSVSSVEGVLLLLRAEEEVARFQTYTMRFRA